MVGFILDWLKGALLGFVQLASIYFIYDIFAEVWFGLIKLSLVLFIIINFGFV